MGKRTGFSTKQLVLEKLDLHVQKNEVELYLTSHAKINSKQDFAGGPVVKTSPSNAGVWVRSLVGELRSNMPRGQKTKTHTKRSNM